MPASVFQSALLHSAEAFECFDRWCGYQCIGVLKGGIASNSGAISSPLAAYPLAGLLTSPSADQRYTGLPVIKALLLVGSARGQPDNRPALQLADGALKALRLAPWKRELPPALAKGATLFQAIDHCRSHVDQRLATPAGLSKPLREWLESLRHWCEILAKPVPGAPLALPRSPRSPFSAPRPGAGEPEPDPPPPPLLIDVDDDVDAPEPPEPPDPGDLGLRTFDAPEPRDIERRAPATKEGDPETEEGGEARRARTGFRSALENQFLPWVNARLNPDDRAELVVALKRDLQSADEALADTAGLLSIAHVTGHLVEQTAGLSLVPLVGASYLADDWALMRYVPLQENAWTPNAEQAARMRKRATHVRLRLPVEVMAWLARRLGERHGADLTDALALAPTVAVARARAWLEPLRSASGGLQTLSRVECWLPQALYQVERDHVPPHLLCAVNDGQPCPSAYYRAYEIHALAALHAKALTAAGWTMPAAAAHKAADKAWVGSQLNPGLDDVKAMWAETTAHFEAIVSDASRPLHERHNAREHHEALSQMFQTFHRVVGDPMESLEFVDLHRRRLLIDDKQQGEARAHRLVPLPSLAARQCSDQIEHVGRLAVVLAPTAPDTAARLVAMIKRPQARAAPFRFLLNDRDQIIRLTPQTLKEALVGVWNLPFNLARHFGSTWLMEQGASDEELTSLLGHHDLGTQNLSLLSPRYFGSLFGEPADATDAESSASGLHARLDAGVEALGLRAIESFLPPVAEGDLPSLAKTLPEPMRFGHQRRAQARARVYLKVREEVDQLLQQHLDGLKSSPLTQADVDALFKKVREATSNRRSHWACVRFEALREALAELMRKDDALKLELPAVALAVKDVVHVCPLDGLTAAQWLCHCRRALWQHWRAELARWRAARTVPGNICPEGLLLTLVVDSLLLDPDIWKSWAASSRQFDVFIDENARSWLRMPLPNRNSRLYPVQRFFAEMLARLPATTWRDVDLDRVAAFANGLVNGFDAAGARLRDFGQLLSRVQAASAAETPGLVLGYADGSHGAVSPETICLERVGGLPPTLASVEARHAGRRALADDVEVRATGSAAMGDRGQLSDEAAFRRAMAAALRKLHRLKFEKPVKRGARKHSANADAANDANETASPSNMKKPGRSPGPIARFIKAMDEQWVDVVSSPKLAPVCGLLAQWMYTLAKVGQSPNEDYAPKTLFNYWFSWGLRVIEEFGPIDPRSMSSAEIEELYLQILEDAEVKNRQHLYPPMRNLHRYLVMNQGVCEIDWTELRSATGQGITHIDANLVHEHEYFAALELLRHDPAASERMRALQSAVLVLLYRGGLRIAECLGLHATDLYLNEDGRWRVRVRGNLYRSLKTDNARRTVVLLEPMTAIESGVLENWAAHVQTFLSARDIQPLFARNAAGVQRRELFPRRTVALRVAQALRAATGDPGTRIHHCRHAYATRMLQLGLGVFTPNGDPVESHDTARRELTAQVRALLASEPDATRRLLWAIAAMLGHASPMTTLQTYAHAGHEWLQNWCAHTVWHEVEGFDVDVGEWLAFACGVTLKTMQRACQRAVIDPDATEAPTPEEVRVRVALATWCSVPRLGAGRRVSPTTALPPLRLVESSSTLLSVDRIIDHARKFGRVDGLADRLFVSEAWIEHVLRAAADFGARHRSGRDPGRWWIVPHDTHYPEHEGVQVDGALERLQAVPREELAAACVVIDRLIDPARRMVVIERAEDLGPVARLSKRLVDDPQFVKLLVPAKLPRRPTPEERLERDKAAMQEAAAQKLPYRRTKPRQPYAATITFEQAAGIVASAKSLGITTMTEHGRVAKARSRSHDAHQPGGRFALTLQENAVDVMRSAKVYTRVLAAATVACEANRLAEATPDDKAGW